MYALNTVSQHRLFTPPQGCNISRKHSPNTADLRRTKCYAPRSIIACEFTTFSGGAISKRTQTTHKPKTTISPDVTPKTISISHDEIPTHCACAQSITLTDGTTIELQQQTRQGRRRCRTPSLSLTLFALSFLSPAISFPRLSTDENRLHGLQTFGCMIQRRARGARARGKEAA